jgi:hypothetical protein
MVFYDISDVSEERITYLRIRFLISFETLVQDYKSLILKTEATRLSETSVIKYKTTRRYNANNYVPAVIHKLAIL